MATPAFPPTAPPGAADLHPQLHALLAAKEGLRTLGASTVDSQQNGTPNGAHCAAIAFETESNAHPLLACMCSTAHLLLACSLQHLCGSPRLQLALAAAELGEHEAA